MSRARNTVKIDSPPAEKFDLAKARTQALNDHRINPIVILVQCAASLADAGTRTGAAGSLRRSDLQCLPSSNCTLNNSASRRKTTRTQIVRKKWFGAPLEMKFVASNTTKAEKLSFSWVSATKANRSCRREQILANIYRSFCHS